jgi:hypothetical protein
VQKADIEHSMALQSMDSTGQEMAAEAMHGAYQKMNPV